ncbi:purine nucleoside phosphorylase [Venturia nashicola]|nr:purine nucleoside phosphorylase [Venturia nashicola]
MPWLSTNLVSQPFFEGRAKVHGRRRSVCEDEDEVGFRMLLMLSGHDGAFTRDLAHLGMSKETLLADDGTYGPGMMGPSEVLRGAAEWMSFSATARRYGSSANGAGRGETRAKVQIRSLFTSNNLNLSDQANARTNEERSDLNITVSRQRKGPKTGVSREFALSQLARRRGRPRINHVSQDNEIFMQDLVESSLLSALKETGSSGMASQNPRSRYSIRLKSARAVSNTGHLLYIGHS